MKYRLPLAATTAVAIAIFLANRDTPPAKAGVQAAPAAPLAEVVNPAARQALFGDLHLHTSFSYDAWGFGPARTTPDDAYRFAQGLPVDFMGKLVRRAEPLDFMAVTDHSEFMGVLNQLDDPSNPLSTSPATAAFRANPFNAFMSLYYKMHKGRAVPELNEQAGMRDAWARAVQAANANYHPGKFTTFIGYEWTSMPGGEANLHRNVIFNGDHAPQPFTSNDSERPEDLWSYLERVRSTGLEAIAIPHNSNASGGLMFDWVDSDRRPISEAYAQRRALNEPLTEIYQIKGASETHTDLSSNDEFANFEKWETLLVSPKKSEPKGSYVRDALGRGLVLQRQAGANPYKFGFVGSSDLHNGLSASAENAFNGRDSFDPNVSTPDREAVAKALTLRKAFDFMGEKPTDEIENPGRMGSAGLTGVWAEHNTRASIFAALRRKETFATSGTRLKLRFFGGWNYSPKLLGDKNWPAAAYRSGVPQGSDLPAALTAGAPKFALWAIKDPNDANLDRIQVIKVWLDGGAYKEKIFDVAWAGKRRIDPRTGKLPAIGTSVDLKTATYKNSIGSVQLQTVWQDPEFDSAKPAVYYARVLQIPTPRWNTYLAVKAGLPLPSSSPATIQERGWSSPIWYTPDRRAGKAR